jgi:hypothetical protein
MSSRHVRGLSLLTKKGWITLFCVVLIVSTFIDSHYVRIGGALTLLWLFLLAPVSRRLQAQSERGKPWHDYMWGMRSDYYPSVRNDFHLYDLKSDDVTFWATGRSGWRNRKEVDIFCGLSESGVTFIIGREFSGKNKGKFGLAAVRFNLNEWSAPVVYKWLSEHRSIAFVLGENEDRLAYFKPPELDDRFHIQDLNVYGPVIGFKC